MAVSNEQFLSQRPYPNITMETFDLSLSNTLISQTFKMEEEVMQAEARAVKEHIKMVAAEGKTPKTVEELVKIFSEEEFIILTALWLTNSVTFKMSGQMSYFHSSSQILVSLLYFQPPRLINGILSVIKELSKEP